MIIRVTYGWFQRQYKMDISDRPWCVPYTTLRNAALATKLSLSAGRKLDP